MRNIGVLLVSVAYCSYSCWTPGKLYRGSVSRTKSGRTCQRWGSGSTHQENPIKLPPSWDRAENYCRNHDYKHMRPWCYTTDPNVRHEECPIRLCRSSKPVNRPTRRPTTLQARTTKPPKEIYSNSFCEDCNSGLCGSVNGPNVFGEKENVTCLNSCHEEHFCTERVY
ncbi:Oidioi.mRNA.OKI2018_I69.chr2.g6527.t1.cds [Oikopleura dioica]|uniref:Oidioi.mRNA.OKI2018_I69.chr2.g6527.t1.cds n=1 Tax=Oikopleura dioica TaxID=34765 RepID=A0ABN7T845_OIKDI|nr:Oidioi.mRNA.OKI2018_I69.chr2.g6527.t1.cds [Oikopleura dioica]